MKKIYTTLRIGNQGRKYVGVNIGNYQLEIPGRQITGTKTKSVSVPGYSRAKTVSYNPANYAKTRMAGTVYGNQDQSIKKTKTIVRQTPSKMVIKTTKYGPANYYGRQSKMITKKVIKR